MSKINALFNIIKNKYIEIRHYILILKTEKDKTVLRLKKLGLNISLNLEIKYYT